jgi:hypothetical protein
MPSPVPAFGKDREYVAMHNAERATRSASIVATLSRNPVADGARFLQFASKL